MPVTAESIPTEELVASDFTLNTFSISLLTAQYARTHVDGGAIGQVPFCQGIRGPETLRREGNASSAAKNESLETIIPELGEQEIK